jgi:hypothetical protein
VEHANIFRRTRAIPKSFAHRDVEREGQRDRRVVRAKHRGRLCWRLEKRQTCICTGKLNIHAVQIRPHGDSFYRLLLLWPTCRSASASVATLNIRRYKRKSCTVSRHAAFVSLRKRLPNAYQALLYPLIFAKIPSPYAENYLARSTMHLLVHELFLSTLSSSESSSKQK